MSPRQLIRRFSTSLLIAGLIVALPNTARAQVEPENASELGIQSLQEQLTETRAEYEVLQQEREYLAQSLDDYILNVRRLEDRLSNPTASDVLGSYYKASVNFYRHDQVLRAHTEAVLSWQLVAAWAVLILVLIVTLLGVVLSFIEVRNAISLPKKAATVASAGRPGRPGRSNQENQMKRSRWNKGSFRRILGARRQNEDQEPPLHDKSDGGGPSATGRGEDQQVSTKPLTQIDISLERLQVTSAVTGVVILVISLGFLFLFVDRVFEINPQDLTGATAISIPPTISEEGERADASEQ